MNWQDRITIDPQVLVGKPIIKGTRISVEHVVKLMADGWSEADVLRSYPHLKPDDLRACLAYVTDMLSSERVYPLTA